MLEVIYHFTIIYGIKHSDLLKNIKNMILINKKFCFYKLECKLHNHEFFILSFVWTLQCTKDRIKEFQNVKNIAFITTKT